MTEDFFARMQPRFVQTRPFSILKALVLSRMFSPLAMPARNFMGWNWACSRKHTAPVVGMGRFGRWISGPW